MSGEHLPRVFLSCLNTLAGGENTPISFWTNSHYSRLMKMEEKIAMSSRPFGVAAFLLLYRGVMPVC